MKQAVADQHNCPPAPGCHKKLKGDITMTKAEKQTFEELVRLVNSRFMACNNEDDERFLRLVFMINPESEVLMRYENTLFDLPQYMCLM